jgi:cell wall-associated NlpC family hydrolase
MVTVMPATTQPAALIEHATACAVTAAAVVRQARAAALVCIWALCFGAAQVRAEPAAGDAVARFLSERGLVDAAHADVSLAQMRERASDWTSDLVVSAMNFLGVNYKRGGQSVEQGFDCSGFTRHVFEASVGLVLPRRAKEQAQTAGLLDVKRDDLKPGDLVFFNTVRTAFSHVGIYVGDGKFIHAPRTGGQVRVEDMRIAYWSKRYNGARRAEPPKLAPAATPQTSDGTPAPAPAPVAVPAAPAAAPATVDRAAFFTAGS